MSSNTLTSQRKLKRFTLPAALVVGGVTVGGLISPIGLASAQESDADETDTTESTETDSTETDSTEAEDGEKGDGEGRRGRHGRRGAKVEVVTESLGITSEQLREGFEAGQSLAQQAEAQGVSVDDLRADLVAAANERIDGALADGKLDESEAEEKRAEVAERIDEFINKDPADFEGRQGRGQGRGHGARAGHPAGEEMAELLGLSTDEIRDALKDGQSLADLAEAQGVSVDDVAATLTAGMEEKVAAALESGRIDEDKAAEIEAQFDENLDDVINGEFEGRRARGGHGRRGGNDGDTPGAETDGSVEDTSVSA